MSVFDEDLDVFSETGPIVLLPYSSYDLINASVDISFPIMRLVKYT